MTATDVKLPPLWVRTKTLVQRAELSPLPVPTWAHHLLELQKDGLWMKSPLPGGFSGGKCLSWGCAFELRKLMLETSWKCCISVPLCPNLISRLTVEQVHSKKGVHTVLM